MSTDLRSLALPTAPQKDDEGVLRQSLLDWAQKDNTQATVPLRGADQEANLVSWMQAFRRYPGLSETFGGLQFLRRVAMAVRNGQPSGPDAQDAAYYLASRWVRFLISEQASQEKFFLQEYVARDNAFYENDHLRPKANLKVWDDLPALKSHQLTITEWELTLAIFTHDGKTWRFTWWLARYPHLLWRIHAFLLRRYCFPLLALFRQAQKNTQKSESNASLDRPPSRAGEQSNASLDRPPFRAGELWRLYPRIGALTFLGLLAIVGLTPALAFFFAGHWLLVAFAVGAAFVVQLVLSGIDVFKQNRGVMVSKGHAWPRVWRLSLRFFLWGFVLAVGFLAACWLTQLLPFEKSALRPLEGWGNILLPEVSLAPAGKGARFLLGVLGLAAASGTLGALLQWIWEERAATEPI